MNKYPAVLAFLLSFSSMSCGTLQPNAVPAQPGVDQREGPSGTQDAPFALSPFRRYDLVLAGGETRYFKMRVPSDWYWKLFITAVNHTEGARGTLRARILPTVPVWKPLPLCDVSKDFDLKDEGEEVALGVGNTGPAQPAVLELKQDGPPIGVILQSEMSPLPGDWFKPLGGIAGPARAGL